MCLHNTNITEILSHLNVSVSTPGSRLAVLIIIIMLQQASQTSVPIFYQLMESIKLTKSNLGTSFNW